MSMMKKKKGFWGGLIAEFAFAIFLVLFVLIFLFNFKYHLTLVMIDYYSWNKQYDIPMALFSTDIKDDSGNYESSVVVLNKIHYGMYTEDEMDEVEDELERVVSVWYGEHGFWTLNFGEFNLIGIEEDPCLCTVEQLGFYRCPDMAKCQSKYYNAKYRVCDPVTHDPCIRVHGNLRALRHLGYYPLPVVFNGTHRNIPLSFVSNLISD